MDKKSLLAIVICMLLILAWQPVMNMIWPPRPKALPPATGTNSVAVVEAPAGATNAPAAATAWQPAPGSPKKASDKRPAPAPAAETPVRTVLENDDIRIDLTNIGAGIDTVTLKKHVNTHLSDSARENVSLKLAHRDENGLTVPGFAVLGLPHIGPSTPFAVKSASDQVVYEATSPSGLTVRKTFTLRPEDQYSPLLQVEIINGTDKPISLREAMLSLGLMAPTIETESPHYTAFDIYSKESVTRQTFDKVKKEPWRFNEPVTWAASKNQFFAVIVEPETLPADFLLASRAPFPLKAGRENEIITALGMGNIVLSPGHQTTLDYQIYTGPREFKRLRELGEDKDRVMAYEVFMGMSIKLFGYFTEFLLGVLVWINGYVHNFGLSIVLITILIKLVFWWPSAASMNSMRKMAALQPKVQALQEKYKNDREKLGREMMKLYRDYKISPLSGCLPALLQMPVFVGFYSMLQSSIELRGAHFLWIQDLSQPDTVAHVFGFPINPMPLIMAATMFLQMQMSPTTMDNMQKRIFMLMPVMFLVFCYNFSSGLSLYWTVQNLLTIFQTWLSLRKGPPVLEKQEESSKN